MANRVLLGKRGTSDYGLFVSRSSENVLTTTAPLGFDSRAVESLTVHSYGQGFLIPSVTNSVGTALTFTYNSTTYSDDEVTISHGLGYKPAYAVRWCRVSDLSSGVATKVWTPNQAQYSFFEVDEDTEEETSGGADGGIDVRLNSTSPYALYMRNAYGIDDNGDNYVSSIGSSSVIAYSYVIFTAENFLNGASL